MQVKIKKRHEGRIIRVQGKGEIKEVLIIEPDIFQDNRGWFFEPYNKEKFNNAGINTDFVQDNHSLPKYN